MAGRETTREREPESDRPDERRAGAETPAPAHEDLLALQRGAGNRATAALIGRREITSGEGAQIRFSVGSDLGIALVGLAWSATAAGPLDDAAVARLRATALGPDETIDDNERMFIAALLDAGNARSWHEQGPAGLTPGALIAFPTASITAANRERVRDFGRGTRPPEPPREESADPAVHARQLDEDIVAMAGSFGQAARDALAIADAAKISHVAIYFAMLNGASDSTPGDRAFAGAVYAIARREGLAVAADIMARRIKVDQVPASGLPSNAKAMYQPTAGVAGTKGDTVYLPSGMQFLDLIGQATVVHELTHAVDDAETEKPHKGAVVDSELSAFRAEAGFLLQAVARRSGADRDRAVLQIAKEIRAPTLWCMVLEATEVLENTPALAALAEIHAKVDSDGDSGTALELPASQLRRLLARLADEEQHYDAYAEVEKHARKAIATAYKGIAAATDDGLRGESVLDAGTAPVARAPLARQPAGDQKQPGPAPVTDEIEFIIGGDIGVDFARAAKKAAAGKLTQATELSLHDVALKEDDTISDAERMVIAALADPANAKRMAAVKVEETQVVKLAFTRDAATQARLRAVADLRRPAQPKGLDAKGAEKKLLTLAGGQKAAMNATIAFARATGVDLAELLEAAIAAASDSTAGDQVAAAAVYAVAQSAGLATAADVRAGRIKVDQQTKLASGIEGFAAHGLYQTAPDDQRRKHAAAVKGDTLYIGKDFAIGTVADRATVVHELQHAADDKAAGSARAPTLRSSLDLELGGYVAGARYALGELTKATGKDRATAVSALVKQWEAKQALALVVAARTEASSTPGAWKERKPAADAAAAAADLVAEFAKQKASDPAASLVASALTDEFVQLVQGLSGEVMRGGAVDPRGLTVLDGLGGEGMLDTIGRPAAPRPPARAP